MRLFIAHAIAFVNNLCYAFLEMSAKEDIRSWCHDLPPSFAKSGQVERLTGTIYYGDKKQWQLPALIRSCKGRKNCVVEVVELFLLAPRTNSPAKRRKALAAAVEEITEAGARIRELNTGDESPKNLARMMLRASDMIARSGRGKRSAINGAKSKGRPRSFTKEQLAAARIRWFSREYKTGVEAEAAIHALGIKMKRTYLYNKFGPRNPRDPADE